MNAETTSSGDGSVSRTHGEHVIHLARQLADGNRPGVLGTVDPEGLPHVRWMATLSLRNFPHLYALTSPSTRKIGHIRAHPRVTWMFANDSFSIVVNLSGTAKVLTEPSEINRVWRLIENKANAYFLDWNGGADGIAVIDTLIEHVECVVPRYDLHYPLVKK